MKRKNKYNEVYRAKTGRKIPCPGEAHSNAFIDNCGMCAPRWGIIDELADIDLDDAKVKRLNVPMPELTRSQLADAHAYERDGLAKIKMVDHGGRAYFVLQWL